MTYVMTLTNHWQCIKTVNTKSKSRAEKTVQSEIPVKRVLGKS